MKSLRKGIVEDAVGEQDWGAWHTVRNPLLSWPLPEGEKVFRGREKERKCAETGRGRVEIRFLPELSAMETAVLDPEGSFSNDQDWGYDLTCAPGRPLSSEDGPFSRSHHFKGHL